MAAKTLKRLFPSYAPAFLLGFISLLAQTIVIRTLLSVFSGNELIIGLVFGLWILFVALGSMLANHVKQDIRLLSGFLFILSGTLVQLINSTAWYIYNIAGLSFGEVIPLPATLLFLTALMMPICLVFGAEFPLIVRVFNESTSVVYGVESIGAFFGGALFSLFIAGYISDRAVSCWVSLLSVVAAIVLLKKKEIYIFLIIPFVLYLFLPHSLEQVVTGRIVNRADSPEGKIIATEISGQRNIYLSGKLSFSIPEPQSEELLSHIPALFTEPDDVLIIGGSPMLIKEYLRYKSDITYIQINKKLLSLSIKLLSPTDRKLIINSPCVHIVTNDARAFLKKTSDKFNIIVLNKPFPTTAALNRYYTEEFFKVVSNHLKKTGVFLLKLMAVPGYMSNDMLIANSSIFMTLKKVFPHVRVTSMEYALVIASNNPVNVEPVKQASMFSQLNLKTLYLDSSVVEDMFSPEKSWEFEQLLEKRKKINTDRHPVSYIYNIVLWTETSGGKWLAIVLSNAEPVLILLVLITLLLTFYLGKQEGGYASAVLFVSGFTALSLVSISVYLYQSIVGHIYRMIGLMGAVYMLGSATGALAVKRNEQRKVTLYVTLSLVIILLLSYPFVTRRAFMIFIVVFLSGLLGGRLFSISAHLIKNAALAYSLDLTGALFGAFVTSVFLFPIFGLYYTTGFLVYLNILPIIVIWMYQKKRPSTG